MTLTKGPGSRPGHYNIVFLQIQGGNDGNDEQNQFLHMLLTDYGMLDYPGCHPAQEPWKSRCIVIWGENMDNSWQTIAVRDSDAFQDSLPAMTSASPPVYPQRSHPHRTVFSYSFEGFQPLTFLRNSAVLKSILTKSNPSDKKDRVGLKP